ncbi:MAG: transferase [Calothrix sp. C42_A2020_038]|nr:transferase [Calothrix sp. C42_A2020_038]
MSVPPLRLGSSFESYISGEVIVHPSAVIAPGVILRAAPNSKIIIGAGVCIGMGSVIQLDTGTLEIEPGASLGAGFLMVGEGKIGANACIGSATTVFRCSVSPGQVVAPGSILGDKGRNTIENETTTLNPSKALAAQTAPQQELEDVWATNSSNSSNGYNPSNTIKQSSLDSTSQENNSSTVPSPSTNSTTSESQSQPSKTSIQPQPNTEQNTFGTHISGQTSIQRLLVTLFPHRQALNKPLLDDSESE